MMVVLIVNCVLLAGKGMDLRDLPWEDRERVLRLLFAKINNQAQQTYYANLPHHPLGGNVSGLGGVE